MVRQSQTSNLTVPNWTDPTDIHCWVS